MTRAQTRTRHRTNYLDRHVIICDGLEGCSRSGINDNMATRCSNVGDSMSPILPCEEAQRLNFKAIWMSIRRLL